MRKLKIVNIFLAILILFIPVIAFSGHGVHVSKVISTLASAANADITATMSAPTANRFNLVTCYMVQLVNGTSGASSTKAVEISTTGLSTDMHFFINRNTTAQSVTTEKECFVNPVRATSRQATVQMWGNSGDANTTLHITLIGYVGL